jgi:hypothetical protein
MLRFLIRWIKGPAKGRPSRRPVFHLPETAEQYELILGQIQGENQQVLTRRKAESDRLLTEAERLRKKASKSSAPQAELLRRQAEMMHPSNEGCYYIDPEAYAEYRARAWERALIVEGEVVYVTTYTPPHPPLRRNG